MENKIFNQRTIKYIGVFAIVIGVASRYVNFISIEIKNLILICTGIILVILISKYYYSLYRSKNKKHIVNLYLLIGMVLLTITISILYRLKL